MGARQNWVVCLTVALVCALLPAAAGAQSADAPEDRCTVKNAAIKVGGRAVDPPVKLIPDPNSQSRVINFGTNRDEKYATFNVTAEPPLPKGLEKRLGLVADTILRVGNEKAETVLFPDPTFSRVRVSGNRERISFDVCLDPPSDLSAGSYTGVITLDAPPGVENTAVTVTANAKNGDLFKIGFVLTVLAALFILFYKEAARRREAAIQAAGTDTAKKARAEKWGQHLGDAVNFGWVVGTLIALAGMFGVLLALWDDSPSWGDAGLGSVVVLIGAGLAAIGAKEIFSSNRGP
jgi:hypothetical protein